MIARCPLPRCPALAEGDPEAAFATIAHHVMEDHSAEDRWYFGLVVPALLFLVGSLRRGSS